MSKKFTAWNTQIIELIPSKVTRKNIRQSDNSFLKIIFFIEKWYFYSYIAFISYRVYLKVMSVKINYKKNLSKKNLSNEVLFVDEKFNISSLKKHILSSEYLYIGDLIKSRDLDKKIITFDYSSKKKIILISIKKELKSSEVENLGAKFYELCKSFKNFGLRFSCVDKSIKTLLILIFFSFIKRLTLIGLGALG